MKAVVMALAEAIITLAAAEAAIVPKSSKN
jgi:hypothetical protein